MTVPTALRRGVKNLLRELRRRHVVETAGFYVAGGWVLIEVADIVFPIFNVPDLVLRILFVAVVAAFPVVLVVSWTFNISIKGLIRTSETPAVTAAAVDSKKIPKRSVAVLPFTDLTGDQPNFFGDGLAEELLNLLTKIKGLKVAARTSSFAFRDRDVDVREIGSLLGVRHVLEGSVRRSGNRLRITAQLVETPTGYHRWSETFDRTMDDIFAVEDEIAAALVNALQLALEGDAAGVRGADELPTDNIEAHQFVLRASYLLHRRGSDAIKGAIAALEEAVALDPEYADAHARLAAAEAILHEYTLEPREPDFARAEAYARKAIALDDSLGEPHGVLGYMASRLWRWHESEQHLRTAIDLQPALPTLHQWYANVLNDVGRHDDAHREAAAAHAIDPLSPTANNVLAMTALFRSDSECAAKHAATAREYGIGVGLPDYIDFVLRLRAGEFEQAATDWKRVQSRGGKQANWVNVFVSAVDDRKQIPQATKALANAERDELIDSFALFFHLCLLAAPMAFDVGEKMLADHAAEHAWLLLPEADPLVRTPRFEHFMSRIGVLDYWRSTSFPERFRHLS